LVHRGSADDREREDSCIKTCIYIYL
jgi:hypothetical protein